MQELQVQSQSQNDPQEEGMATHSSILAGESQGQRSLVGYRSWGCKQSDTTEATKQACTHTRILSHCLTHEETEAQRS